MISSSKLLTVIETKLFRKRVKQLGLSSDEIDDLIMHVSAHPQDGVALGQGLWKIRAKQPGAGKSGGYRVLYFYLQPEFPVFLLTIFAKNEKQTLSDAEEQSLKQACERIEAQLRRSRN